MVHASLAPRRQGVGGLNAPVGVGLLARFLCPSHRFVFHVYMSFVDVGWARWDERGEWNEGRLDGWGE